MVRCNSYRLTWRIGDSCNYNIYIYIYRVTITTIKWVLTMIVDHWLTEMCIQVIGYPFKEFSVLLRGWKQKRTRELNPMPMFRLPGSSMLDFKCVCVPVITTVTFELALSQTSTLRVMRDILTVGQHHSESFETRFASLSFLIFIGCYELSWFLMAWCSGSSSLSNLKRVNIACSLVMHQIWATKTL
jgi:hypothetical protein